MTRKAVRNVSWIKAARKDFADFPTGAADQAADALTVIAEGGTPDIAKPLTGVGGGVWELAIKQRGDAFRVVYALQLDDDIWIVHAFQKKSKRGIATPKHEIDLVLERIKRLKEVLNDKRKR
jgi:phage-related protein